MYLNQVTLVGRVGRDPEMKSTPAGVSVTTLSLATTRSWKDKNGEKQEQTEWHNVVFWQKQAEVVAQWVKKGQEILIVGRNQTRTYEKDGTKMYRTEVIAEKFEFGQKAGGSGEDTRSEADKEFDSIGEPEGDAPSKPSAKGKASPKSKPVDAEDINPEDIPF